MMTAVVAASGLRRSFGDQVEEVENIFTHALFMNRGRAIHCDSMPALEEEYVELRAMGPAVALAESIPHVGQRPLLGGWLLNALWVLLAATVWLRRYRWEI